MKFFVVFFACEILSVARRALQGAAELELRMALLQLQLRLQLQLLLQLHMQLQVQLQLRLRFDSRCCQKEAKVMPRTELKAGSTDH